MPNGEGGVGSSMPSCLSRCSVVFIDFAPCSVPMLSDEFSQVIFCIAGFAKASPNQLLDPLLRGRPCHRSDARVPSGFDFDIRRQTSDIDKPPGVHDCPFVEGRESVCKRIVTSGKL